MNVQASPKKRINKMNIMRITYNRFQI